MLTVSDILSAARLNYEICGNSRCFVEPNHPLPDIYPLEQADAHDKLISVRMELIQDPATGEYRYVQR